MKQKSIKKTLGITGSVLVFLAGAFIGVALLVIAVWADLEASVFDSSIKGEKTIRSVSCPMIITTGEVGEVQASFTNDYDRIIKPVIRVHISDGFATYMREENTNFELAPQETRQFSWTVTPDDAAFGQFILVKIYRYQINRIPSYQATCGIYVVDVDGLTGAQITWGALALSFVGMLGGGTAFSLIDRPLKNTRKAVFNAMIVFSAFLLIGYVLSYFGMWLLAAISLVVLVLIILGSIAQLLK